MHYGTISKVIEGRGFGFIEAPGRAGDLFFHFTELADPTLFGVRLIGARVSFELGTDWQGRDVATRVRIAP